LGPIVVIVVTLFGFGVVVTLGRESGGRGLGRSSGGVALFAWGDAGRGLGLCWERKSIRVKEKGKWELERLERGARG